MRFGEVRRGEAKRIAALFLSLSRSREEIRDARVGGRCVAPPPVGQSARILGDQNVRSWLGFATLPRSLPADRREGTLLKRRGIV